MSLLLFYAALEFRVMVMGHRAYLQQVCQSRLAYAQMTRGMTQWHVEPQTANKFESQPNTKSDPVLNNVLTVCNM